MSAALRILKAGPGATVQDGGRRGYLRAGVTAAGPMDALAFATANLAIGAAPGCGVIEVGLGGITLAAEGGAVTLAVAGAPFVISLGEQTFEAPLVLTLSPGDTLAIRPGASGAWCYVAAGGFTIAPVLGSQATHTRSHMGGLDGGPLKAGDALPLLPASAAATAPARLIAPWLDRRSDTIRVVLGPQDDYFAPDQIAAFLDRPWTLSPRCDRMGYLLDGEPLTHAKGFNIVSDGIAEGAVQVPGEGRPIVLMADRQPTGGYPKIATVIGADLGAFAQLRPGARVRFAAVSVAEAVGARRAQAEALTRPAARAALVRTEFTSELLLGLNLAGGAVDALAPDA